MKQFILLSILLFCCSVCFSTADGGKVAPPPYQFQAQPLLSNKQDIVTVYANTGSITLYFNSTFNNINISIEDETGMLVYQQSTSVNKEQRILINAGSWDNGIYYITITDTNGNIIYQHDIEY